jgi:hypothetical protein
LLADVCDRIATILVEQVITARGKFHADENVWAQIMYGDEEIFAFLLVHVFFRYCCIPPCEMHFLLVR